MWWPLPVGAARWFTEHERAEARRYHDPIERAGFWSLGAQVLGLVAVVGLTRIVDVGLVGTVIAVAAALGVPRIVSNGWREFSHEPTFGHRPVSAGAFGFTAAGRVAVEAALLAVAAWWLDRGAVQAADLVIPVAVAFGLPVVVTLIGPRFVLATHRATDLPAGSAASHHARDLAAAHGMRAPRLVVLDSSTFDGANAFATGTGDRITVAVSRRLLDGPTELYGHVVSHELAHLRRRHLWWSAIGSGVSLASITAVSIVAANGVDSTSTSLPVLVIVAGTVAVPFRLALAWWSRVNERQADQDALALAPVRPNVVKQLHLSDQAAVDPSRSARLFGPHPAPAERLERIARFT